MPFANYQTLAIRHSRHLIDIFRLICCVMSSQLRWCEYRCLMKTGLLDEETKQTSLRYTIERPGMPMPYDEKQRQAA